MRQGNGREIYSYGYMQVIGSVGKCGIMCCVLWDRGNEVGMNDL
jgi:hypothetical protein